MCDILLTGETLNLTSGDFNTINNLLMIRQHVIVAMNTFYQDWILDKNKGINYVYGLKYPRFLESEIKKQLSEITGVKCVENFSLEFDNSTLSFNVSAILKTIYGKTEIFEKITST